MNSEDLKFLATRAETIRGRADQRLAEVHARIRTARRRRVTIAVAGLSAAVLTLIIGIDLLIGPIGSDKNGGPVPPANSANPMPTAGATRSLVYSDLGSREYRDGRIQTIHVNGRDVEIDQTLRTIRFWDLQVTDAGVVYDKGDGSVWFSDGGQPRQVAKHACQGSIGSRAPTVASGSTGPWAVWFDCSRGEAGALVVFDTASGREVARKLIPSCRPKAWSACAPDDVLRAHVYLTSRYFAGQQHSGRLTVRSLVYDVEAGRVIRKTRGLQADDLRNDPRTLVVGDSWPSGARESGPSFEVVGRRLVPVAYQPEPEPRRTRAFEAASGERVRLRLPRGYHPHPAAGFHGDEVVAHFTRFSVFEWLDDDTVALAQDTDGQGSGAIITCHLSDGRCKLAVKEPPSGTVRMVPGGSLPG